MAAPHGRYTYGAGWAIFPPWAALIGGANVGIVSVKMCIGRGKNLFRTLFDENLMTYAPFVLLFEKNQYPTL